MSWYISSLVDIITYYTNKINPFVYDNLDYTLDKILSESTDMNVNKTIIVYKSIVKRIQSHNDLISCKISNDPQFAHIDLDLSFDISTTLFANLEHLNSLDIPEKLAIIDLPNIMWKYISYIDNLALLNIKYLLEQVSKTDFIEQRKMITLNTSYDDIISFMENYNIFDDDYTFAWFDIFRLHETYYIQNIIHE